MALASFYSAAPLDLNGTVLPAEDLRVSMGVVAAEIRHSGNLFSSVQIVPGAQPRLSAKIPFAEAYALIGLQALKLTACNVYFAKFVDSARAATSVHRKYALTAGAVGYAMITGMSTSHGSVAWADIEVVFLSSDGMAHPLTATDNSALPALASQPALRSIGPISVNGTAYFGVSGLSLDLGNKLETFVGDGHLYPTVAAYVGGDPVLNIETSDPATAISGVGLVGAAASANIIAYLRDYSTTTHLSLTTGISITVGSGRIIPEDLGASSLGVAKGNLRVTALSSTTTHPMVVATGATLPTP